MATNHQTRSKAKCKTTFDCPLALDSTERVPLSNAIKTSHYTWWNFLFLNLFEQFHRLANVFFLSCATLQVIPIISPLNPVMGFLSLSGMLAISMVKAAFEDYKRHIADDKLNGKITTVWSSNEKKLLKMKWQDINPGDIIVLKANDEFPADCVILKTASNDGKCRIETSALDGETNIKFRSIISKEESFHNKEFTVEISDPKPNMRSFSGNIRLDDNLHPLSIENFVARGCFLRKTREVTALVVYTGENTKIIQNSLKPRFKYTEIDRFMAKCVVCLVGILFVFAIVFDVCAYFWTQRHYCDAYLNLEHQSNVYYVYNVFSWFLIINCMIPLCVYTSLDLVRFFLSLSISSDKTMMEGESSVRCQNSDLVSTIGRITHIFSDKTGTLTKNRMTFKAAGFGELIIGNEKVDSADNQYEENNERLISISQENIDSFKEQAKKNEKIQLFLYTLCLCNSAVTAVNQDYYSIDTIKEKFPEFEYTYDLPPAEIVAQFPYIISFQTSSSDELALLHFARECGFILYSVFGDIVMLIVEGEVVRIERPVVFEFSSNRKRSSCISKLDEKYLLLMKGADSVVFGCSEEISDKLPENLTSLSSNGLRTLVYANKIVDNAKGVIEEYKRIRLMTSDQDDSVIKLAERVENGLHSFAVTGVKDELQDEVQNTLITLRQAGVKIWMLTGDKLDTALNIAFSCGLKPPSGDVIIVNSLDDIGELENRFNLNDKNDNRNQVDSKDQIELDDQPDHRNRIDLKDQNDLEKTLIAVEGSLITNIFQSDRFFAIAKRSASVVCARSEPSQKGDCVRMFKQKDPSAEVLAIGDGANDVDMIRAADVGVGVEGREGSDAVMSSDFCVPSFRHISRLLIVHGRWCVNRTSLLIIMTFYKTTMIAFMQMLFGMFNGFSATSAYDSGYLSIYNLLLAIPQLFFICVLEEDVDAKYVMAVPQTYAEFAEGKTIGFMPMFWMYFHALIHSSLIFFFSYFECNSVLLDITGKTFDLPIFSQITGWTVLLVFTCELLMKFRTITVIHVMLYIICILIYIIMTYFYSSGDKMFYNILGITFSVPRIWFTIPFCVGLCIIVDMIGFYWSPILFPSVSESVAELEHKAKKGVKC